MTRVWIAQCLCPQQHVILAVAGEAENRGEAQATIVNPLRAHVGRLLQAEVFNPWCPSCQFPAESWNYKLSRTRFLSMEDAEPDLQRGESGQAVRREVFGG